MPMHNVGRTPTATDPEAADFRGRIRLHSAAKTEPFFLVKALHARGVSR